VQEEEDNECKKAFESPKYGKGSKIEGASVMQKCVQFLLVYLMYSEKEKVAKRRIAVIGGTVEVNTW
jgi:hypothetical protein